MLASKYKSKYLNQLKVLFTNKEDQLDENEIQKLKQKLDNATQYLEDVVMGLWDVKNSRYIYLSENVEKLSGYSREKIYKMNFFSPIAFSHFSYPFRILKYNKQFGLKLSPQERQRVTLASCGLKVKDKCGQTKKLLIKTSVVSLDKFNMPRILIEQWENILPIYKGDHYWARWKCQNQTFVFVNKRGKKEFKDLLSPREEEIVDLVTKGKNNQAIAEVLYLSKSTVETHRKNILRKTGFTSIEAFSYIWNRIK